MAVMAPHLVKQKRGKASDLIRMFQLLARRGLGDVEVVKE